MENKFVMKSSGSRLYFLLTIASVFFAFDALVIYQLIINKTSFFDGFFGIIFMSAIAASFCQYAVADKIIVHDRDISFRYFLTHKYRFLLFPVVAKKSIDKTNIKSITIAPLYYFEKNMSDFGGNEELGRVIKRIRIKTVATLPIWALPATAGTTPVVYVKSKQEGKNDIVFDTRNSFSKKETTKFVDYLKNIGISASFIN